MKVYKLYYLYSFFAKYGITTPPILLDVNKNDGHKYLININYNFQNRIDKIIKNNLFYYCFFGSTKLNCLNF